MLGTGESDEEDTVFSLQQVYVYQTERARITQICAKKHAMMYVPNAGTEGGVVFATQRAILQSANIWQSGSGPRRGVGVIAETREEQGPALVELTL